MYIKRAVEEAILKASKAFPVLLVTGPRQVGKTTTLKMLSEKNRTYVTLDDVTVRQLAKTEPALFLQRYRQPVLIDEIQYAPELLSYIKIEVDNSGKKGDYWLTGSQMFHMMSGVTESLAGRVGIINMLGLSNAEIDNRKSTAFTTDRDSLVEKSKTAKPLDLKEVYSRIFKGSMPALYADDIEPEIYYSSYLRTYLERDIRHLTQVGDETTFFNFMTIIAARTSKPLVYEEVAKEVGISAPTVKKWISILHSSYIIALVQPYHNNVLKRVVKQPLLHFFDTGLCTYLLKWGGAETLERGAMSGAFFENYVFAEIYKSYLNTGKEPPIYYYRDKDKKEIDLLIYKDGSVCPVEIKKSASPNKDAVKHFSVLNPIVAPEKFGGMSSLKTDVGQGAVVCMINDVLPIDEKNSFVPVWVI